MNAVNSKINDEVINSIRNSVNIVEIISDYIPLTKKGRNYFGVCPFHSDHSPSMSVSEERQIYKCFSCGAAGNVFKFLMDYENINFMEAVKIVADRTGITFEYKKANNYVNENTRDLYKIFEISQMFYTNNINTKDGIKAKQYLKERQINEQIIKEFGIGLSLKKNDILTNLLLKKKYNENLMLKSGLINKNNSYMNDVYYNRIMFPLYDTTGKIVGYSGRIYDNSDTSKYINTKETEIFKKGELLYNYHRAKDEARKKDIIIVMEGFMDVIRAHSVGIKNVVATMGTAVTDKQVLLIKRLAHEVILCFDGDKAGFKATFSCINELSKIGVIPKIIILENNLDPDEYIRKFGVDKFQTKIDNPINIMDFKLMYLKENKNLNDSIDTANYINEILKELNNIEDEILKEITLNKISEEYKIDSKLLTEKLNKLKENNNISVVVPKKKIEIKNKYLSSEQNLLYYMLDNKEVVKMYEKRITFIPTDKYRKLAREINYFCKQNGHINTADLMTFEKDNLDILNTINEIISLDLKENYSIEEIEDYIKTIKEYNLKNETNRLKDEIRKETDPIKKAEIAQKIIDIKKMK